MNGMQAINAENGRGLGILGMRERALLVDGEIKLYSSPGNGTKVCIGIPLKTDEKYA
jgi:signal transduction histidine kinase